MRIQTLNTKIALTKYFVQTFTRQFLNCVLVQKGPTIIFKSSNVWGIAGAAMLKFQPNLQSIIIILEELRNDQ